MISGKIYKLLLKGTVLSLTLLITTGIASQTPVDSLLSKIDPQKLAQSVEAKLDQVKVRLLKKTEAVLVKMRREEERLLKKRLAASDSSQLKDELNALQLKYAELQIQPHPSGLSSEAKIYIPRLDSVQTALQFLSKGADDGILKSVLEKSALLQGQLQQAERVKLFIRQRKENLKQELEKLGLIRELKKINKQVYYYAAQVREYREILNDPKKMEKKALELLSKTKLFREFMRKNSLLASLFRLPDPDKPVDMASLAGLQTRAQVTALVQAQIASGGPNAAQQFQQNINAAQSQLNQLKDKLMKAGNKAIEGEIPDFKPNTQKTKSFLQRLELGTNLQTRRAGNYFPTTTDLGLSLGYKLNDNSIIGVGGSYKLGLGRGWNAIRFSHEGLGLRSFVDIKLKGSFWLSGGYEQNYLASFRDFDQLRERSAWQQSGLIGLNKQISIRSKFFKRSTARLLWDFLSYRQVPRGQAVVFRVGYNF